MSLIRVFENLSYESVLNIADDFDFYPSQEYPKEVFDEIFAEFLERNGRTAEVLTRYGVSKDIPEDVDSGIVKLFSFQVRHKELMIEGLSNHTVFINASETGTGKTYKTMSLAETERRPLFVICPKSMVLEWYLQGLKHKVEILAVCNYETMIKGKMYVFKSDADTEKLPRVENPYMKRVEKSNGGKKKTISFEWQNLPEGTLIVFDEAHFCKNTTAQRTQLLMAAYDFARHPENTWRRIGILLLSATIIEKKENLSPFMYVLGFADSPKDTKVIENHEFSVREFGRKLITERRMTRATMAEAREALKDFHTSDIRPKVFQLNEEDRAKIESLSQEIRAMVMSTTKGKSKSPLAVRLQKRREIEALKVAVVVPECKQLYEEGWAVAIFFNFRDALSACEAMLKTQMPGVQYSVIIGGQTAAARLRETQKFVDGKTHIILAMITAGGIGISLHDVKGVRPHAGLLFPPESATQLIQALGRLNRLGSKSDSKQRIIFIKGTIEEKIAENLSRKIQTISDLNNDDERADNLFLFDVYHEYDKPEADEEQKKIDTIEITVDKKEKKIVVTVPDYMVDAFENNIPTEAVTTMRIQGKKYFFDLAFFATIKEYLVKLNA